MKTVENPLESGFDPNKELRDLMSQQHAQLSLTGLTEVIRNRRQGVSGPERKGAMKVILPSKVEPLIDDLTSAWSGHSKVVSYVCTSLNKLVDREKMDSRAVNKTLLAEEVAAKISRLAKVGEYPTTKYAQDGLARLVMNMSTEQAEYYLSEDFVIELQDMAVDVPDLEYEIGDYFTIANLLRRANQSRNPDQLVRNAVLASADLLKDDRHRLKEIAGDSADDRFLNTITPNMILYATTSAPTTYEELLKKSAERFNQLAEKYPLFTDTDPESMVYLLLKSSTNGDLGKVKEKCETIEKNLKKAEVRDPGNKALTYSTTRHSRANMSYGELDERANAFFVHQTLHDPSRNSKRHAQLSEALSRGRLHKEDFAAVRYGNEYRNLLIAIDESDKFENHQKQELFTKIRQSRRAVDSFTDKFSGAFGEHADTVYTKLNERITSVLYAAEYYMEHGEKAARVRMGSKDIDVSVEPSEIVRAVTFLSEGLRMLAAIEPAKGDVMEHSNVEIGYVNGTNNEVLIATKQQRDEVTMPILRGRSARINFVIGMGGIVPSSDAEQREQSALSIRMDYDDGKLMIDMGGKTDNPYTPDFMVAKVVSLGAWQKSKASGETPKDYHVEINQDMSESEFADLVEAFRKVVPISPTGLRVPHAR